MPKRAAPPDIEEPLFAVDVVAAVQKDMLEWYDAGHRSLPWRLEASSGKNFVSPDARAYAVWVSEIMLQQTQVERVKEYYRRWMTRWPTVRDLATASLEEVREAWQGLGYYRRARFLLEGAQAIVAADGGQLPVDVAGWRQVRGVGQYTAGAIASIAYEQRAAAVDGNVIRVLTRLRAIGGDPSESTTSRLLWRLADALVPEGRPGDWNQALMELGATVCTPLSPRCSTCPLARHCVAFAEQKAVRDPAVAPVTRFPCKAKKKPPREEHLLVCAVQRAREEGGGSPLRGAPRRKGRAAGPGTRVDEFLLLKRPEEAAGKGTKLLAGLWELPTVPLPLVVQLANEVIEGEEDELEKLTSPAVAGRDTAAAPPARSALLDAHAIMEAHLRPYVGAVRLAADAVAVCTEPVVHTFSHVQHRMHVELLVLSRAPDDAVEAPDNKSHVAGDQQARWVTAEEMMQVSTSNGMRKAFKLVLEHGTEGKTAKRKAARSQCSQRDLTFFWRAD